MMNNSFEKQIKDKVNGAEVSPSDGLLDSIFEKRAAKARPVSVLGKTGWILAAAMLVITLGVLFFNERNGDLSNNGIADNNTSDANPVTEQPRDNKVNSNSPAMNGVVEPSVSHGRTAVSENQSVRDTRSASGAHSQATSGRRNTALAAATNSEDHSKLSKADNNRSFASDIDPNSYFNVDALNRPVIELEKHNGNSHMYVYQSVDPGLIEDAAVGNSSIFAAQPFRSAFESPEYSDHSLLAMRSENSLRSKNPLFLDLIYSPGLSFFHATGYTQNAGSYNAVNTGGSMSQFGVRITKPVYKGLSVFGGIFQVNQVSRYKGDLPYEINEQKVDKHIRYINDPINGVITVVTYDTQNVTNSYKHKVDYRNQYSLIRIPVGLSYNFGSGNFDFAVNAAMDLNYLANAKGSYFNRETRNISTFGIAGRSVNIGSSLSFMSAYKLSNKFRLILEPGLQYMSLKGKNTGNVVNERLLNFNLGLGIRYTVF